MSGPSIDLEKPNMIGGLDKLVTNFAMSIIAVFPTFLACIVTPWRLTPLLKRDDPDGCMGMLLAPGAFFPLSLMVSFLMAAVLATPETLSNNGAYIGPGLAISVQSAASDGDVWKIIATIMPIYGIAIFIGLLGMVCKPWVHKDWTLRVSLRAAFYVFGTLTSWMILTTAIVDLIFLSKGGYETASHVYSIIMVPTLGVVIWMYSCFLRNNGTISWIRSVALSLVLIVLIAALMWLTDFLVRL